MAGTEMSLRTFLAELEARGLRKRSLGRSCGRWMPRFRTPERALTARSARKLEIASVKRSDLVLHGAHVGIVFDYIVRGLQARGQLVDNVLFLFLLHLTSAGLLSSQGGLPAVFGGSMARPEL